MAQSVPHWWGMFFTQQTSCLPYAFLTYSSWYIGMYTVDTLLYCIPYALPIVSFPSFLNSHLILKSLLEVLQPELFLKVITISLPLYKGSC